MLPPGVDALEAGDDRHRPLLQGLSHAVGVDADDAGAAEGAVGLDAHLVAEERPRRYAEVVQDECRQRAGDLLARRRQDVGLAVVGPGVGFPGQAEQPIGLTGHGGDHDRHLMAGGARTRDARRHVADAVQVGDRGPAELLYDERHDSPSRGARRRPYRPTGPRRVDRLPPAAVPGWAAGGSRSNHSTAARPRAAEHPRRA